MCIVFLACTGGENHEKGVSAGTSIMAVKSDTARKKVMDNRVGDKILGIWAYAGDENATFVIAKGKITYPDQNASYKYILTGDSLRIKFPGYEGNYLVKTRGADTLVLKGEDEQVYYRFK